MKTLSFLNLAMIAAFASTGCESAVPTTPDFSLFVSVPGGTFIQASDINGDGDIIDTAEALYHTISAFHMGKYEVTYELWYTVYQWAITKGYSFCNAGREGDDGTDGAPPTAAKNEPATKMTWRDVIGWCNAYSEMQGLTPVYCLDAGFTTAVKDSTNAYSVSINTTAGSVDNPYVNWSANGYRLPTEGEWQYAASYIDGATWQLWCDASGATVHSSDAAATGLVAWYGPNSGSVTHDVGGKNPNALCIYDMSGNVWEWCWDWDGSYAGPSLVDYRGATSGTQRMRRGDSFGYDANWIGVGLRVSTAPHACLPDVGIRLVRAR